MRISRSSRIVVFAAAMLLGAVSATNAQTVSIAGLYVTGVDNSGVQLGNNALDAHYVVTASSLGSGYTGSSYVIKSSAVPVAWVPNTSTARWITDPKPGGNDGDPTRPAGTFDYTLTFTMPTGAQLVSISGTGAADDSATIYVNGILVTGQTVGGAGSTNSFTLDSSNASFASTTNTITFRVNNAGSTTGLLIASLSGTAVVPEVGAFLPVALALGLVALVRVYRPRSAQT